MLKKENEFFSIIKRAELTDCEESIVLYRICNWVGKSRVLDAEQIVTFRRMLISIIEIMKEEIMKTTVTCPNCGEEIPSLEKCYISTQETTLRYIKGDKYVLGDQLEFDMPEIETDSEYYQCPLCRESVCSSDERALEFLKGE